MPFLLSSPVFRLPPCSALVLFLRERELSRYLYGGPTFGGKRSGGLFVVLFYFTTSHQPPQTPLFTFPDFPLPYPPFFPLYFANPLSWAPSSPFEEAFFRIYRDTRTRGNDGENSLHGCGRGWEKGGEKGWGECRNSVRESV